MNAEVEAAYAAGLEHGKRYEREMCALLVDQLGRDGCNFFRLALEIRRRSYTDGNEAMSPLRRTQENHRVF